MKPLSFLLVFLVFNLSCLAQQESQTQMLEDAVRSLKVPSPIIYIDSALNYYGLVSEVSKRKSGPKTSSAVAVVTTLRIDAGIRQSCGFDSISCSLVWLSETAMQMLAFNNPGVVCQSLIFC